MPNWKKLIKYKVIASEGETAREYYVWYQNKWKQYPGAREFSAYHNGKPPRDVVFINNAIKKWTRGRPYRKARQAFKAFRKSYKKNS